MAFWKYKEESKRLNQQEGLGDWATRPLENRETSSGQQSKSAVLNPTPFSQRKAKNKQVQEVQDLTPTPSEHNPEVSTTEQQHTNSDRPRDDISPSTPETGTSSSSKPSFIPFSHKHLRKR